MPPKKPRKSETGGDKLPPSVERDPDTLTPDTAADEDHDETDIVVPPGYERPAE